MPIWGQQYETKRHEWDLWVRSNLGGSDDQMREAAESAMRAATSGASPDEAAERARNAWAQHRLRHGRPRTGAGLRLLGRGADHATRPDELRSDATDGTAEQRPH